MSSEIKVDTISEKTSTNGVTIDGVKIKDNAVETNTISEGTSGSGVTIDGALLKDSKLASGTGNVLQVVSMSGDAAVTVNSSTYTSLVSVSITPSATSSKILLFATGDGNPGTGTVWNYIRFFRDSTDIGNYVIMQTAGSSYNSVFALHTLDSPSSTSAITYKIQAKQGSGTMTYGEEGATQSPTITAIEVGG